MIRKLAAAALIAATGIAGLSSAAEARHYYGGYGYYPNGYARHHGWGRDHYGYACHDKGNGGLAIGAIAGGLLGNQIAGRGDRLLGTVIGAAGGGLAGRAIDRHDGRC